MRARVWKTLLAGVLLATGCIDIASVEADFCAKRPALCPSTNGAVDPAASTMIALPATGVYADGYASAQISVTVKDLAGRAVAGLPVTLGSTSVGAQLTQPATPTNAAGTALGELRALEPGVKEVTASVVQDGNPIALSGVVTVTFVAPPPRSVHAGNSQLGVVPNTVVANGVATATITVVVRDASNQPIAGQQVSVTATGSANTIVQPGLTDATGTASGTISTPVAGLRTLQATVNPGPTQVVLAAQPQVLFIGDADAVSAALSTVTASPATQIADGSSAVTVTVTVKDVNGNPVPEADVSVSSSNAQDTFGTIARTNAEGVTTAALRTTVGGARELTATAEGVTLAGRPSVTFTGNPATLSSSLSTVNVSTSTLVANGVDVVAIDVVLKDAFGNLVGGQPLSLQASGSNNTFEPVSGVLTDAAGAARVTLRSTRAEQKTITVRAGGSLLPLDQRPEVTFIADAANLSPTLSTVGVSPTSVVANGTASSTVTVQVKDLNGNNVPGCTVSLAVSGSANVVSAPALTDATGTTTATVKSTVAGDKTVTATAQGTGGPAVLVQQPIIQFTADPTRVSASQSTVVVSPASLVANGNSTTTVTVTLKDAAGVPLQGMSVALAATGTGNLISGPQGLTDLNGQITATLASTTAESKQVTATANPGPQQTVLNARPTVVFTADANNVSASLSTVTATPDLVLADDSATAAIEVVVRDAHGNPVPAATVQVAATGTGHSITTPAATNTSGTTSCFIRSSVAEPKKLRVVVFPGAANEVTLTSQPVVLFSGDPNALSSTNTTITASPASGVVADGTQYSTATVTLRDTSNRIVPRLTVTFSGTSLMLTPGAALTDEYGVATTQVRSTVSGPKSVFAAAGGLTLGYVNLSFVADASNLSATLSTVTAEPDTVRADGVMTSAIRVTVKDANGNPVPGQSVSLASSGEGVVLTQPPATDANGTAAGALRTTATGTKTVTATINPGPSQVVVAQQPQITAVPDVSTALSALTVDKAVALADGTDVVTITVTARSSAGVPVPNLPVALHVSGEQNTLTYQGDRTDAAGQLRATLVSLRSGRKVVSAKINPGPAQVMPAAAEVLFNLTAPPAVAFTTSLAQPTDACRDVRYTLSTPDGSPLDLEVEFAANATAPFSRATQAPGYLEGTVGLSTSPAGAPHTFSWDVAADLPGADLPEVRLRLTATREGAPLASVTSGPLEVRHALGFLAQLPASSGLPFPNLVAAMDLNRDGRMDMVVGDGASNTVVPRIAQPSGTFVNGSPVTISTLPRDFAVADLSRDGIDDLVIAGETLLVVLLGNGNGGFQPPLGYTATALQALTVADFDGDALVDVAAGTGTGEVIWWPGSAAGPLTNPNTLSLADTAPVSDLVPYDVDRDGRQDLLVAGTVASNVWWFRNQGGRAFAAPQFMGSSSTKKLALVDYNRDLSPDLVVMRTMEVMVADVATTGIMPVRSLATTAGVFTEVRAGWIDRDAAQDLVVSDSTGGLQVIRGGAAPPAWFFDPILMLPSTAAMTVTLADFNGDGMSDPVIPTGGNIQVHLASQTPRCAVKFAGAQVSELVPRVASAITQQGVASFVDVNLDGKLDAIGAYATNLGVALGLGDGSFAAPAVITLPQPGWTTAAGDFNGDGYPDLAVALTDAQVAVLFNLGDNQWDAPVLLPLGTLKAAELHAADLDADGDTDLFATLLPVTTHYAAQAQTVGALLSNGDGTFAPPVTTQVALATGTPTSPVAGLSGTSLVDLDRNGAPDLLHATHVGDGSTTWLVAAFRPGVGDGTFGPPVFFPRLATNETFYTAGASDVDGDGWLDVVRVAAVASEYRVSVHRGEGAFGFAPAIVSPVANGYAVARFGDMDRDGAADLLMLGDAGVRIHRGAGDGSFQQAANVAALGLPLKGGLVTDVNADGQVDVVGYGYTHERAVAVLGNGFGGFVAAAQTPNGLNAAVGVQGLVVADLTGDGRDDVAYTGPLASGSGTMHLSLGAGDGTFGGPQTFGTSASYGGLAAGDFDKDGDLDLVAGAGSDLVFYRKEASPPLFVPQLPKTFSGTVGQLATLDLQRDGKLDVVFRSSSTQLTVAHGDGTGAFPTSSVYSATANSSALSHPLVVADMNRDGLQDVVYLAGAAVGVLASNTAGTLVPAGTAQDPAMTMVNAFAAGELTGDGIPDLVLVGIVSSVTRVQVFRGGAGMSFTAGAFVNLSANRVAIADVDDDGRPDVVAFGGGAVTVLFGNGDGTFRAMRGFGGPSSLARVSDLNGDGRVDLAGAISGMPQLP